MNLCPSVYSITCWRLPLFRSNEYDNMSISVRLFVYNTRVANFDLKANASGHHLTSNITHTSIAQRPTQCSLLVGARLVRPPPQSSPSHHLLRRLILLSDSPLRAPRPVSSSWRTLWRQPVLLTRCSFFLLLLLLRRLPPAE